MTDPYATLGVSKTMTDKEIRSAYRRLAKQYHPDYNPGDAKAEERFKAINTAYGIIGDKDRRARFDRGEIDAEGQERGSFGGGGFQDGMGAEDIGDFFSDMFGGGFGASRSRRGVDVQGELRITFLESVLGTERDISLGGGRTTNVRIPPGLEDGKTLRLRGKGMSGHSGRDGTPGPAGDFLLKVHVVPDGYYTREGYNLRVTQDIGLKTAVLGGKVHVRTPKGTVALKVKAHSDSGMILRIPGRGIAGYGRRPAGDLFVMLRIILGKIDPALEAFLRQQADIGAASGERTAS